MAVGDAIVQATVPASAEPIATGAQVSITFAADDLHGMDE
jgi:hypothetical protein